MWWWISTNPTLPIITNNLVWHHSPLTHKTPTASHKHYPSWAGAKIKFLPQEKSTLFSRTVKITGIVCDFVTLGLGVLQWVFFQHTSQAGSCLLNNFYHKDHNHKSDNSSDSERSSYRYIQRYSKTCLQGKLRWVWFGLFEFNVPLSQYWTDISRPCQPEKLIPLLPWPGFDPSFSGHNDRRAIISEWTWLRLRPLSHRGWQETPMRGHPVIRGHHLRTVSYLHNAKHLLIVLNRKYRYILLS